jgi:hypothetical protein
MSVTLSEVKRAARAHRAPLAGESAGYLVLALADQVLSAPRLIEARDIQLTDDGGLRVLRGQASSETDAELSLRRALDGLLLVASSGSAALMRASRRVSPVGLPGLVRELEAALIPVNRGAARRALARLSRETARALASGVLAEDEPEVREPAPLPEVRATVVAVAEPARAVEVPAEEPAPEGDELETCAIIVPVPVELPPPSSNGEGALSTLSEDTETTPDASPVSGALTLAIDVCAAVDATPTESILLEEDIEFIDEEPSDALTVVRDIEVAPIAIANAAEQALVDLPEEACTRPEPIILRQAQRTFARPELSPPSVEAPSRTPTLGSLAAELPVLAPELIAEMTRLEGLAPSVVTEPSVEVEMSPEPSGLPAEVEDSVRSWAAGEQSTDPMPEVAPLSPGVAIVASRKSDVSELLADFQVAPDDTHQGLRRAIKEMAELDLTPAPFAALIR